jgi:hypothetical protein
MSDSDGGGAIDAAASEAEFSERSKLTGIVMRKGKGARVSHRSRCSGVFIAGRPVTTRLTRTMRFVESPPTPCACGSIDADGTEDPFEDLAGGAH